MKIFPVFFIAYLLMCGLSFAQSDDSTDTDDDSLLVQTDSLGIKDTTKSADSLRSAFLNNPERKKITEIIRNVNSNSSKIDMLHSENVVKIKAASIENTGEIEIRMKRFDDLWFRISGGFAFVNKDAFFAHFNRQKFIYFDNLNNKVIEGPTTTGNIGIIARIKCSFDDLMNVMSGACMINFSDNDTLSMTEDDMNYIITVKGRKNLKYWVEKRTYNVVKYAYINIKFKEYLRIMYSNFAKAGEGYYARKVEIIRPNTNEYLKIVNENYTLNNPVLNFNVDFPTDARRVIWDK